MTIQEDFRDVVFEFAKEACKYENVLSVILFGSVARGEADRRSDVDILVVFDTRENVRSLDVKNKISKISLDLEKKFDENIQLVFSNKHFEGLDRQFVENSLREGVILLGKNPQVDIERLKLGSYSLINYSLKNLKKSEKMKIKRIFYGHITKKVYKGKVYRSSMKGLIKELGGKRTGIASLLVPSRKAEDIINVLKRFGAKFERTDLWMSEI